MSKHLLQTLQSRKASNKKSFAVLIDPGKTSLSQTQTIIHLAEQQAVDCLLVGGSLLDRQAQHELITFLKAHTSLPVVLFPGHGMHVDLQADALLFLSLVSGRNPELLIGQHVQVAPLLKNSTLEVIATAYLLVDPGHSTSVSYMSNTLPIPRSKSDIAAATASAAEMLGMQLTYLDAGSGAELPVPEAMIRRVCRSVDSPVIVGGGINTPQKAEEALKAGADMLVIGNGIEKNPNLIEGVSLLIRHYNEREDLNVHQ